MRKSFSKFALAATIGFALVFTFSCSSSDADQNSQSGGVGSCSGEPVQIGNQFWQKCNSNVNPNKGTSKCYDDKTANCDNFGRLYDWEAAMFACPTGFHLPTKNEWEVLINFVESDKGCENCAAKHLKSKNGWNSCSTSGSSYSCLDTYGFSALPGGYTSSDGNFGNANYVGVWWSNEADGSDAYYLSMDHDHEYVENNYNTKSRLYSVRCLKDD